MQRGWVSGALGALVLAALALNACQERAPAEQASPGAEETSEPVSPETLKHLRDRARHDPEAALTELEVLAIQRESAGSPVTDELKDIRALAELTRFNTAVRAVSTNDNLRESTRLVLELVDRPEPKNKGRLGEALWGLIGRLEAQIPTDPAMVHSNARRLLAHEGLLELLGTQMTERLRSAEGTALRHKIDTRIKALMAKGSFEEVLAQLSRWRAADQGQKPSRALIAVTQIVEGLEARIEAQDTEDTTIRSDTVAMLDREELRGLIEAGELAERVRAVLDRTGEARLTEWLTGIDAKARRRPAEAAKIGCRALGYARTPKEKSRVAEAAKVVEPHLDRGARRAAQAYLDAIGKRDFKAWRATEGPFLEGESLPPEGFAKTRALWASELAELDPRDKELQLLGGEFDLCRLRATFVIGLPTLSRRAATLVMCWDADRAGWYPCRTLTRWATKAMIAP